MPSWKRILKVPSSNDQTDVKISAAEFHFSAALVFYAFIFKNESLFIVTPMQNLKHNGKLGFGVLYGALEAHAGVVADKVQRAEKGFVIRGILRCHGYAADGVCDVRVHKDIAAPLYHFRRAVFAYEVIVVAQQLKVRVVDLFDKLQSFRLHCENICFFVPQRLQRDGDTVLFTGVT